MNVSWNKQFQMNVALYPMILGGWHFKGLRKIAFSFKTVCFTKPFILGGISRTPQVATTRLYTAQRYFIMHV